MVRGRVVRFDEAKGYGFARPDDGGDDVFLHVNDLEFDERLIEVGRIVEFEVEDSDRGPKGSRIRLADGVGLRGQGGEMFGDVISRPAFQAEVTEALIDAAPTLTGAQIADVRRRLAQLAYSHGWLDAL